MGSKLIRDMSVRGLYEAGRITLADWFGVNGKPARANQVHCKAAMDWLYAAQDATPDGGVSRGYLSLSRKWAASYPETTGYIIPTFFDYFHATGDDECKIRALRMADWEISIQMDSGAFQSGSMNNFPQVPAVFNTGQVIFGLARAHTETGEAKYRRAAERAADWLVAVQDNDGAWRKYLSSLTNSPVHTYNTRTAWALLEAHTILPKDIYTNAAVKNIKWALTQQLENGWFQNCTFNVNDVPLLHTIAYAIEGILECGIHLNSRVFIDAAAKSGDMLLQLQQRNGSLFGKYNSEWKNTVRWSCLVGDAQTSVIWLKLYELTRDRRYLDAAKRMNHYLKKAQDLDSDEKGIRGGIKGSQPFSGGYGPFWYLNWAAKFFVDALLLEDKSEVV